MSESINLSATVKGDRIAYDGGRNVTYDMSGNDERFYNGSSTNLKPYGVVVFQPNQIYTFQIPVYLKNSSDETMISVQKLVQTTDKNGAITGTSWEDVPYGSTGWQEVEVDTAAMSQAYLMDTEGTWDFQLVKQIQFGLLTGSGEKITLRIFAHKFYMDLYDVNGFDGVGPSYTPALGKWILDKLQELDATMSQNIENVFGISDSVNDMLDEDLTGIAPANYVQDETHTVNTSTGMDTLMPARGSFYSHDFCMWQYTIRTGTVQMANKKYNLENQAIFIYSVTTNIGSTTSKTTTTKRVYLTEANYDNYIGMAGSFIDRTKLKLMVPGVDYELTNLNVAKTEMSESEYGVYDTVRLLTAISGSVLISYHAFGGAVVFEDVQDMRQDIMNLIKIFASKNLVTSDILAAQPVIKNIMSRLLVMEQYHNHFNQVEHAVYMGSSGYHWINIAQLYDVAWGEEISAIDEIGTFRVESKQRGWCYEFIVSVDLKKKLVNALRCKTLGTNDVTSVDLKDYVLYLKGRDDVAIRVIWNGDGTKSGVMLQLGWNYDNYTYPVNGVDTDTIIVTSKSGSTSKWKLYYDPLDNTYDDVSSRHICNHTQYEVTEDLTFKDSKEYFWFESMFTYYRTASETVQQDVEYFTLVNDPLNETSYYEKVELTPTMKVADYISGTLTPACPNGVYERALYKKVPRLLIAGTDYNVGDEIEDQENTFEVSDSSYSNDTNVEMPSTQHTWIDGNLGSNKLTQLLEPSDGLVAWAGSVKLDFYNASTLTINSLLSTDAQEILEMMTIKGMTVRLYDRKLDKIITRNVDVGYTDAEYKATTDTIAQTGKWYYECTGSGTISDPYRYHRATVTAGVTDVSELFELVTGDHIVGQVIFDLLDLCGAKVEIYKEEKTNLVKFVFDIFMGTDSAINRRFDLRQIELHF